MGSQSQTRLKRLSSSSMFSAFFPVGKEKAVLNSVNRDSVGNCFARIYCALLLFMYKAVLITGHLKSLLTIQVESIQILPCLDDQIHKKMCLILGAHSLNRVIFIRTIILEYSYVTIEMNHIEFVINLKFKSSLFKN